MTFGMETVSDQEAKMGDFKFACQHCGQPLEAGEDMIGIKLPCPTCNQPITVPSPHAKKSIFTTPVSTLPEIIPLPEQSHHKTLSHQADRTTFETGAVKSEKLPAPPVKTEESFASRYSGCGCLLVGVVVLLFAFTPLGYYGCAAFKSYEYKADYMFRREKAEFIAALHSPDPKKRAWYASHIGEEYGRKAILFVPYLIELLGDDSSLQIIQGPPIATEKLGTVVGKTTPGGCALYSLETITGQDFGKNPAKWRDWWNSWWKENRHRFKENPEG